MERNATAEAAPRVEWDVFLSSRGEDTRRGFTRRLYRALGDRRARAFLDDDDGLRRVDEIAPRLVEAIEDSAAAVVVLSEGYADSPWCLEGLARICELSRVVLPVFYRVDPSHVRKQAGPFEAGFRAHEEKFGADEVSRWRRAMEKVGGIAGVPVSEHSGEEQIIESLVEMVLKEISKTPVRLGYTVGIESSIEELTSLLDLKSNGTIKVLGLYGMGGIGKTTLAKALFNRLLGHGFKRRSFVSNVREASARENGLEPLQRKLVDDLSELPKSEEDEEVSRDRKALVVLDDIDNESQLKALIVANRERLYQGSRIIVTTRNKRALPEHIVDVKYEVRELRLDNALELFSYHALRRENPTENLLSLSKEIVSLTGGLPLALEVFGSMLFDKRRVEEWRDALHKLRQIRPANLQDVLKISFDGLDEEQKCVFLDIACLLSSTGMERGYAVDVLNGCGFDAEIAISDLTAKSLVKITTENVVSMHDQVRDMGRQIVKQESIVDPCLRSRLWNRDDIETVLFDDKRRNCAQGIVLDFVTRKLLVKDIDGGRIAWNRLWRSPNFTNALDYLKETYKQYQEDQVEKSKEIKIWAKALGTMMNLRLLQVNHVNLEGDFKFPPDLKWLEWKGCPLKCLRSDTCARSLVVLDLSESRIESVWSQYSRKVAENLKVLNLSKCPYLVSLPELSGNKKLEKLYLKNCVGITKIDESIRDMNTLVHLDLQGCSNLMKIPSDVSGWKCLESLVLSGCLKLKELPKNIGNMISLKELLVDETAIESLPESIFRLTRLEKLNLNRCRRLKTLPICIGKLCSLKELSLNETGVEELPGSVGCLENLERLSVIGCSSLTVLPDSIGNLRLLKDLRFFATSIREVPDCVGSLPNLKTLSMGKGKFVGALPRSIGGLHSLVELQIDETSITHLPDEIGDLKSLKKLHLQKCESLVSLPESIGKMLSLTSLIIFEGKISELPESIGMLENLVMLRLNLCRELRKLPSSIGNLKSLHRLLLQETAVTELPESFGRLSSLVLLRLSKNPRALDYNESNELLAQSAQEGVFFPSSFSNLSSLTELNVCARKITGKIPDDFEKLGSLEILNLGYNHFFGLPSSLKDLSVLKELLLPNCRELKSLPPLPSSLIKVDVADCIALESVSDISNLESLEELNLTNCEKVEDIPGLEYLKSLKRLYMSCCDTCSLVTKKRLAKASLRKIRNLSMPGSKIPAWFTQDVVTFAERRNRPIKGVTIGVVVSLDHRIQDDMMNKLPGIVDIQAQILKQDFPIFTTDFNLSGVPRRSEDQVHLCRYSVHSPLVSLLKEGYKIVVTKKNPPYMKGVELKKWGVHLVYEGDDDYEGDEGSLNESQQSISEKLAKFFSTYEEDGFVSECSTEVERKVPESSGRAESKYLSTAFSLPCNLIVIFSLLLLCCWFYLHTRYLYA